MFFNPDDPNGLDLSQSFGKGGQKPGGSFDMASNAGGQSAGAGGPGASAWPTQPSMGSAPAQGGGGSAIENYLRSLQQNAGQSQQPQHGILNQLLFGQQGWQQHMPQGGVLSALFQKFGGAQQPAGPPTQLPGASMAGPGQSSPGPAPSPINVPGPGTGPNPPTPSPPTPSPAPTPSGAPANAFAGGQGGGFLAQLLASLAGGASGAA